jgi:hypothetical protein
MCSTYKVAISACAGLLKCRSTPCCLLTHWTAAAAACDCPALALPGGMSQDNTTVTVSVCNTPPTAAVSSPTGSYSLACNGQLTLDGSASTDPDAAAGDAVVGWAWTVTDKAGAVVATGIDPTLTLTNTQLPAGATYSATLIVSDTQGAVSSPSPKVSLSALPCGLPPVAKLSGGALTMSCGGSTKLDGEAASRTLPPATVALPVLVVSTDVHCTVAPCMRHVTSTLQAHLWRCRLLANLLTQTDFMPEHKPLHALALQSPADVTASAIA